MDIQLPLGWQQKFDLFDKLILTKILRPQKVMNSVAKYIQKNIGKFFLQTPNVTIKSLWQTSDKVTPIIFILSPGADPTTSLLKFAAQLGIQQNTNMISLGQGQGPFAQHLIQKGKQDGRWIILQNCHLAKSWMPNLQLLAERNRQLSDQIHQDFRLFLTSMPADYFPVSVLQNGLKITTQPPRGIKNNLKRSWNQITQQTLLACPKRVQQLHKLQWGLTFFHAVIQQRRKFGPLGWNIKYQFNMSDLQTSRTIMVMLLNQQQNIPWDALTFIIGNINYGGRVTDDWDRRCLLTILKKFINPQILQGKYHFAEYAQDFYLPQYGSLDQYKQYIDQLPLLDSPQIFGMHQNANISYQFQQSDKITSTILSMQPRISTAAGQTPQQKVAKIVLQINSQLPIILNVNKGLAELFQVDQRGLIPSLSTVLLQQISRFNTLLTVIKISLQELKRAIDGQTIMSQQLDQMYKALLNNQVPQNWKKVAYPSLKSLRSWIRDLKQRVAFMNDWLNKGMPTCFWISGFFFPQGFMTGTMQSHARQPGKQIPIDELAWSFKFNDMDKQTCTTKPLQGIYVYGLFLDGASFDRKKKILADAPNGQTYMSMPVIHFLPFKTTRQDGTPLPVLIQKYQIYSCPVYKTSQRAGVLTTTGQSSNFILAVDFYSGDQPPDFWILRGVALLCQLNQ